MSATIPRRELRAVVHRVQRYRWQPIQHGLHTHIWQDIVSGPSGTVLMTRCAATGDVFVYVVHTKEVERGQHVRREHE